MVKVEQSRDLLQLQRKIDARIEIRKKDKLAKIKKTLQDPTPGKIYILLHSEKIGRCWNWMGPRDIKGYGRGSFYGRGSRAHRISYMAFKGTVGDMHVLHKCNNPCCVNPDHLYLGTNLDNVRDREESGNGAFKKGRMASNRLLSDEQANKIKEGLRSGYSSELLALKFQVKASVIKDIKRGRSYFNSDKITTK